MRENNLREYQSIITKQSFFLHLKVWSLLTASRSNATWLTKSNSFTLSYYSLTRTPNNFWSKRTKWNTKSYCISLSLSLSLRGKMCAHRNYFLILCGMLRKFQLSLSVINIFGTSLNGNVFDAFVYWKIWEMFHGIPLVTMNPSIARKTTEWKHIIQVECLQSSGISLIPSLSLSAL